MESQLLPPLFTCTVLRSLDRGSAPLSSHFTVRCAPARFPLEPNFVKLPKIISWALFSLLFERFLSKYGKNLNVKSIRLKKGLKKFKRFKRDIFWRIILICVSLLLTVVIPTIKNSTFFKRSRMKSCLTLSQSYTSHSAFC